MKAAKLLKTRCTGSDKQYIQFKIVNPTGSLEILETDINQIWIARDRRYAYILTHHN